MSVDQLQNEKLQAVPKPDQTTELEAFNKIISVIQSLPYDAQMRVVKSALTFLGWTESVPERKNPLPQPEGIHAGSTSSFSEDRSLSPKAFILQKKPVTDIEKVACLAYYLTHYRDIPHFKTLEISKLNTEAAQVKLANAAKSVNNATTVGLLVPAGKGSKQISALGELYVQSLPDRDAAKAAIAHAKPRRKYRRSGSADDSDEPEGK